MWSDDCDKKRATMKAIFIKSVIVLSGMTSCLLVAGQARTSVASFALSGSSLHTPKKFTNKTKKTLSLKWQVYDRQADNGYAQEPMMKPGESCMVDLPVAMSHLQAKSGKKKQLYEASISLGVVTKAPSKPRVGLQYRKLKGSETGMIMLKKDFLEHHEFELYKAHKGKIQYRIVS